MGYDHAAPRRQISMTLNADLLRQAEALPGNLDETVETLLAAHLAAAQAGSDELLAQLQQWGQASDAYVARYGLPGEGEDPF